MTTDNKMKKLRIGIIEDSIAINEMYCVKFEKVGCEVETAYEGISGLELVEHFKPDLVLLDIMMPKMNGVEILAKMRKKPWGKDVPVIILSNIDRESAPDGLKDLKFNSYMIKADYTPKQVFHEALKILGLPIPKDD